MITWQRLIRRSGWTPVFTRWSAASLASVAHTDETDVARSEPNLSRAVHRGG
jgi:hypothetical protein